MSDAVTLLTDAAGAPRSRAATRQVWVAQLARFRDSGLRPAAFCAAEGVSLPSLYSWKRRLAAEAAGDTGAAAGGAEVRARLLPVRLATASPGVELALPGGAVLRLAPGCDPAFVAALVEALGGRSC
jgi:hypothetical protein